MWPFKKKLPRVLWLDSWRSTGELDISIQQVERLGPYFCVRKYGGSEAHLLQPGGKVRGRERIFWEKIDDIPGLTGASIVRAEEAQSPIARGEANPRSNP